MEFLDNLKTSSLELRNPHVSKDFLPELVANKIVNNSEQVLALARQTLLDSLSDLVLRAQRHVDVDPVLKRACLVHCHIVVFLKLEKSFVTLFFVLVEYR